MPNDKKIMGDKIFWIVTEGERDVFILDAILSEKTKSLAYIQNGYSKNNAVSLANTLLTTSDLPVLLAIDADTNNDNQAIEKSKEIEALFGSTSSREKFKVVMFLPEIEIIFLEALSTLRKIFDCNLSEPEISVGRFDPKRFLANLFNRKRYSGVGQTASLSGTVYAKNPHPRILENEIKSIIEKLDKEEYQAIRNNTPIAQIESFASLVGKNRLNK